MNMYRTSCLFSLLFCTAVSACVTNAGGPSFIEAPRSGSDAALDRVYVYRDHATYLTQAPQIVRAQVSIDGKPIGGLANGGYFVATVASGAHYLSAASSNELTLRHFTAAPGQDVFVEIYDKTRMEGARAFVAGGIAGPIGGAVGGAAAGGASGVLTGGLYSEASQPDDQNGRYWDVEFRTRSEAIETLKVLRLSE
jgi:hypothetical protein